MDNLASGLFSFRGRMGRGEFWALLIGIGVLSWALLMVGSMIVLALVGGAATGLGTLHVAAQALLQLAALWPQLAVITKRGHDRGYPAAMSIGLAGVATGAFILAAFNPLFSVLGWLIWVYVLIDYGFFPGTPGRNKYDGDGSTRASADREATAKLFD